MPWTRRGEFYLEARCTMSEGGPIHLGAGRCQCPCLEKLPDGGRCNFQRDHVRSTDALERLHGYRGGEVRS